MFCCHIDGKYEFLREKRSGFSIPDGGLIFSIEWTENLNSGLILQKVDVI